jgi:hypothetical protein
MGIVTLMFEIEHSNHWLDTGVGRSQCIECDQELPGDNIRNRSASKDVIFKTSAYHFQLCHF